MADRSVPDADRVVIAAGAFVGDSCEEPPGRMLGRTGSSGHRMTDVLVGDPLPRIC